MRPERRVASRLPLCTLLVVGLAVGASAGPAALRDALELRRAAVLEGELWRLLTGHLIHGSLTLAIWDLGALLLLGSWVEQRSRAELLACLGLGALASGVGVVVLRPDLAWYEGCSALCSALLAAEALRLLGREQGRAQRTLAALGLAGLAAKILLESQLPASSPALAGSPALESVALAHLAGGLAGAAVCVCAHAAAAPHRLRLGGRAPKQCT